MHALGAVEPTQVANALSAGYGDIPLAAEADPQPTTALVPPRFPRSNPTSLRSDHPVWAGGNLPLLFDFTPERSA